MTVRVFVLLACLGIPEICAANTIRIKTLDASEAPLAKVLVIVRSVSNSHEDGRFLTDANGETPDVQVDAGLHQVIATYPYASWRTVVRDFLAETWTGTMTLLIPPMPTDQLGELIHPRRITLFVEAAHAGMESTSGRSVYIRDYQAIRQAWYKTDRNGKVNIAEFKNGTHVVVIYGGQAFQFVLSSECKEQPHQDPEAICSAVEGGTTHLKLPSKAVIP